MKNLPTNDPTVTINPDQRLFVLQHGEGKSAGYSCIGFDVAFRWAQGYANWAGVDAPDPTIIGTAAGYDDYKRCHDAAYAHHRATGDRCPSQLEPRLIGKEGARVEVIAPSGERSRFWVGKSTGWCPIHLEIKTRRSYGGGSAYIPEGATITVVAAHR